MAGSWEDWVVDNDSVDVRVMVGFKDSGFNNLFVDDLEVEEESTTETLGLASNFEFSSENAQ